ncbi:MAG: DUF4276 family protein [Chloroflexota bacterium]|nr:DUF4276 family protein [Chloroflexota bacterium]
MKHIYIITEGVTDQEILKTVLPPIVLNGVNFIAGAGRYAVQSLARSILATEQVPVALVVDADTTTDTAIREQLDFLRNSLGQASFGVKFEVFLAIPEMEILLIQDWDFIRQLTGKSKFSAIEIEFAKLHPKKFLLSILGDAEPYDVALQSFLKKISDQTIETIQKYPLVNQLGEFLLSVINPNLELSRRPILHAATLTRAAFSSRPGR